MQKLTAYILILFVFIVISGCSSVSMVSLPPLSSAARSGNTMAVKELLTAGSSVCEKDTRGLTPYMWVFQDYGAVNAEPVRTCRNETYRILMENAYESVNNGSQCPSLLGYAAMGGCNAIVKKLLDKGFKIEDKISIYGITSLAGAAFYDQFETVKLLVNNGADLNSAMKDLKDISSRQVPYLNSPANRKSYDKANSGIEMLNKLKGYSENLKQAAQRKEAENESGAAFQAVLREYLAAAVKPELPEEARKFKVQAESAVRDKDFSDAVDLYGQALKIAPWWAEGRFNRALVLGEISDYVAAISEMKRYLALAPNAPNARAVQDKIYDWERKIRKQSAIME